MIWILIGVGGALGALARHAFSTLITTRLSAWTVFPLGTFLVNVSGCFVAGLLLGLAARSPLSVELRTFLTVGVLGGFTTFSAFGAETVVLIQNGYAALAIANVLMHMAVALSAVWVGFVVTG